MEINCEWSLRALNVGAERVQSKRTKIIDDFVYGTIRKVRADMNAEHEADKLKGKGNGGRPRGFNILRLAIERARNSGQTMSDSTLRDIVRLIILRPTNHLFNVSSLYMS